MLVCNLPSLPGHTLNDLDKMVKMWDLKYGYN